MKAKVELENVGGIRGKISFELQQGKVNEVLAPNAMGKTSFVRGLAAVLSAPYQDELIINEAINLGIKGERGSKQEELVNIYENRARVTLTVNGTKKEYIVLKDGTVKEIPFGDERFILGGLLTGECKTVRQLIGGDRDYDNFKWIVSKLSLASGYEEFEKQQQTRKDEAESEKSRIQQKLEELSTKIERITELKEKRDLLLKSQEKLKRKLSKEKLEIAEKRDTLLRRINELREDVGTRKGELKRRENEKRELEIELNKAKKKIEKLKEEENSINIKKITQEVTERRRELDKRINELMDKRDEARYNVDMYQQVLSVMRHQKKEKVLCPACRKSTLTVKEVERALNENEGRVRSFNSEITKLNVEKDKENQREILARKKIDEIEQEINDIIHDEIKPRESDLKKLPAIISKIKDEINKKEQEMDSVTERLKKLKFKEEDESLNRELTELEKNLNEISEEIGNIKGFIEESSSEKVGSKWIEPSLANNIYSEWISFLDSLNEFLRERIHENREKAKNEFNQKIRDLMIKLGFKEFDQIALNPEYRLVVFRKGFINQPIRTLSMSEKYAIATLLQITLKETYLPEVPFFIVDEVILSFDEIRKKKVLEYLSKQAKENNLFILVTKLAEKEKNMIVRPLEI